MSSPETLEYDVTIVGGGVAGSYVAYRLLNGEIERDSKLGRLRAARGGRLRVGLFEYSGRIGGRLLSAQLPKAPALGDDDPDYLRYTEYGGFRFQPQMHIVRDLASLLRLTHQPFPVDEPLNNPVYVRGKRYTKGELAGPGARATESYRLTPFEKAIVQCVYEDYGTGSLATFVANQAFAEVLADYNTPFSQPLPTDPPLSEEQKAQLANNGWSNLQSRYADAFNAEDWATVSRLQKTYEAAKQKARFRGRLFTDWSWWGLRTALLSFEAVAYEEDTGGYNTRFSSGNGPQGIIENYYFSEQVTRNDYTPVPPSEAGDACTNTPGKDPCRNTVWKHISEGYSAIPNQLYEGFLARGGNMPLGLEEHHLDHRNRQLLSFDKVDDGYELLFFKRESNQAITTAQALDAVERDPTAGERVKTKVLIMAMPKRSLDLLVQENFFFTNRTVQQLLDTVIRIPAQRMFMVYPRPWWTDARGEPTCGRSTTDLGLRQLYYWVSSKRNGPSIVLASYTNGQGEEYWRGLQPATDQTFDDLPGARSRSDLVPPNTPDRLEFAYPQGRGPRSATKTMGDLAHEQFKRMVGVPDGAPEPPEPIYAHYQDWTVDPWGGGWHSWKSGADDDDVIPRVMHALPDEDVYICGEAWSNVQGWVQGALNTSETLVQKLGLRWPRWLQRGGTWLGPGSNT